MDLRGCSYCHTLALCGWGNAYGCRAVGNIICRGGHIVSLINHLSKFLMSVSRCSQRLAYCWRAIKTCAPSNEIKINKELQTSMTHSPARLQ
jgi:hypothetical protein